MKVSVLMSVYIKDEPVFLYEALRSLAYQTYQDFELILVFDGPLCTDLIKVIESFKDDLDIIPVPLENNVGLGNALAEGLNYCNCEWVVRMDSDDICRPNRIEKQVGYIISKGQEIDIFGGGIEEFNKVPGDLSSFRKMPEKNSEIRAVFGLYSPLNHVTVAFKKTKVLEVGSYQGGQGFQEDLDLWLRMAASEVIFSNLPGILVDVRVGNDMLARRGGFKYLNNELLLLIKGVKMGVIPVHRFIFQIPIRVIARLCPLNLRAYVYKLVRIIINRSN